MSSRDEKKREAREARAVAESADASAARRQRLIALLGGAALLAVIIVVALVAISQGGEEGDPEASGSAAVAAAPESGIALGDPDAPVTVVEFADPQCPYCAAYTDGILPTLIDDYVATGEVRMELELLTFIGPDSLRLANAGYAATGQDGLWKFMDVAYARQGSENSGYADDSFIESAAIEAGLDPEPLVEAASASEPEPLVEEARSAGADAGVDGTPSFLIGPTGGELVPLDADGRDLGDFQGPIEDAIASAPSSG